MSAKKAIAFLLCILTLSAVFSASVFAGPSENVMPGTAAELEMTDRINRIRVEAGRAPLSEFGGLSDAAKMRAAEVLESGSVAPVRPDGSAWYTVFSDSGLDFKAPEAEEIRAYGSADGEKVFGLWNASDFSPRSRHTLSNSQSRRSSSSFASYTKTSPPSSVLAVTVKHRNIMISSDYTHVGSGADGGAWSCIFCVCTVDSVGLYAQDEVPHTTAARRIADGELIFEVNCRHGKSYAPVYGSVIEGFEPSLVGTQTIKLKYGKREIEAEIYNDFADVERGRWYYLPVKRAYDLGLFAGTAAGYFSPGVTMTRAMFVTVLGKLDGIDTQLYATSPFEDVEEGKWYTPFVCWAAEKGIAAGTGGGYFGPSDTVSRAQICVMIRQYLRLIEADLPDAASPAVFNDADDVPAWAAESVEYCRVKGLVSGDTAGNFNPGRGATRAEAATIVIGLAAALSE